jgi:hypothetical protein
MGFLFQFISLNRFSASLFASPKAPFHTCCKLSPPRRMSQWPEDMRVVLFAATHSIAAHFRAGSTQLLNVTFVNMRIYVHCGIDDGAPPPLTLKSELPASATWTFQDLAKE